MKRQHSDWGTFFGQDTVFAVVERFTLVRREVAVGSKLKV